MAAVTPLKLGTDGKIAQFVSGDTYNLTFFGTNTIPASKLIGTDIVTLGTVTAGGLGTGAVLGSVTITVGSDATGDLHYRNSSGIFTRLGIGSTNQVLTVIGGLPSWQPAAGGGAVSSVFTRTGAVVAVSGDYNTSQVTEVTNLYFTNARAIAAPITGYTSGAGVVAATDSLLQAIQKLNGNTAALITGVSSVNSLTGAVALTGTANRLTISGSNVFDISASYVGQSSITTHGTITSGGLGTGAVIAGVTMTLGSDATGDVYYRNSGGILTRLPIGSSTQVLTVNGGLPSWQPSAGGGASPGGSTTQVQYNNAGAFGGASKVAINANGSLELSLDASPLTPAANTVGIFGRAIANRMFAAQIGPAGIDTALQPLLARNKVGFWCPPGNSTNVPGVVGFLAYTVYGTATARNCATTNLFTRMRRLGYVGSTTAGSPAGARVASAQMTLGTTVGGINVGGFTSIIRWGISDASLVSGARTFVGLSAQTGVISNAEPSTFTNCIGVGHGAADTTLSVYYGGSAAQTPIALGANFPSNTVSTDVYEVAIFCPEGVNNTVYVQVTRLNTGDTTTVTLTAATPGLQLPATVTFLTYRQAWRTNNATAAAAAIDIMSDYIETNF